VQQRLADVAGRVLGPASLAGEWGRARLAARAYSIAGGTTEVNKNIVAERVLVERGWLPAADARIAHPELFADSLADETGVVLPLARSPHPTPWAVLPSERASVRVWSARALEQDSAAARFDGALAPWMLRVLPPARAGSSPIPEDYVVPDESMHLSYAIQWFGFALIVSLGSLALALRRTPGKR